MLTTISSEREAHLVDLATLPMLEVLGPRIAVLSRTDVPGGMPCLLLGTIPAGYVVPMHSHPDVETFVALSAGLEGLSAAGGEPRWVPIGAGDVFHVPAGARHAWRNRSGGPVSTVVLTTARLGRFFEEAGVPVGAGEPAQAPPPAEAVARFLAVAERYGHWNASPEENAAVGIELP